VFNCNNNILKVCRERVSSSIISLLLLIPAKRRHDWRADQGSYD
jgi:hypothetical protein